MLVFPLVSILRVTARRRGPTKIWSIQYVTMFGYTDPVLEYAHNLLPVSSMGLSPFERSVGYQSPIFPSMEYEVVVPSDLPSEASGQRHGAFVQKLQTDPVR